MQEKIGLILILILLVVLLFRRRKLLNQDPELQAAKEEEKRMKKEVARQKKEAKQIKKSEKKAKQKKRKNNFSENQVAPSDVQKNKIEITTPVASQTNATGNQFVKPVANQFTKPIVTQKKFDVDVVDDKLKAEIDFNKTVVVTDNFLDTHTAQGDAPAINAANTFNNAEWDDKPRDMNFSITRQLVEVHTDKTIY